jgi:HD-like signal output (HDOD) protein
MSTLQKDFVDAVKQLEPLPPTIARLTALLAGADWNMHELEECISFDQALTTKLLRIANSALWFRSHAIGSVRDAVMRIGSGTVLALVMGAGVQRRMSRPIPCYGLGEGELWKHSVASALAASVLDAQTDAEVPVEAFAGALLHDIGKLVMARVLTARDQAAKRDSHGMRRLDSPETEVEVAGLDHSALGGVVASHWQLPERLVTAIAFHHTPLETEDAIASVVYAADVVAHRAQALLQKDGGDAAAPASAPENELARAVFDRLEVTPAELEGVVAEVGDELDDVLRRYS